MSDTEDGIEENLENSTLEDLADASDKGIPYWAGGDLEEHRRWGVFNLLANSDIEARVLVQNMELVVKWLKTGEVPKQDKTQGVPWHK